MCRFISAHFREDMLLSVCSTAHTHTMETHSMEKVPSMENFSINQTE